MMIMNNIRLGKFIKFEYEVEVFDITSISIWYLIADNIEFQMFWNSIVIPGFLYQVLVVIKQHP